jgi:hypothetical protein
MTESSEAGEPPAAPAPPVPPALETVLPPVVGALPPTRAASALPQRPRPEPLPQAEPPIRPEPVAHPEPLPLPQTVAPRLSVTRTEPVPEPQAEVLPEAPSARPAEPVAQVDQVAPVEQGMDIAHAEQPTAAAASLWSAAGPAEAGDPDEGELPARFQALGTLLEQDELAGPDEPDAGWPAHGAESGSSWAHAAGPGDAWADALADTLDTNAVPTPGVDVVEPRDGADPQQLPAGLAAVPQEPVPSLVVPPALASAKPTADDPELTALAAALFGPRAHTPIHPRPAPGEGGNRD